MKLIKNSFFWILGFSFLLFSCASTKKDYSVYNPLLTISVTGNSTLPWYEEVNGEIKAAETGTLQDLINNKFKSVDPELVTSVDRLDSAEQSIRSSFENIFGTQVIEKQTLIESKAWTTLSESFFKTLNTNETATDLKDLRSASSFQIRSLCKELGAKGVIIADFEFYKKIVKGNKYNGEISPYITMKLRIIDDKGKEQLYKTFKSTYAKSVHISGRDYDKNALVDLYPEAIESLINQALMSLF